MAYIARSGLVDIAVASGQSVVVGSFGAGTTSIYYASSTIPTVYSLQATVTSGSVTVTPSAATTVRIEASNATDVEYDYGTQPSLTSHPFVATTGLTAKAGGGQSGATALTGNINRVTVCATAADSALLPAGLVGRKVSVYNAGAASCSVYPQTGESINSGAANAAFAVGTTKSAVFECVATGLWNAVLGA